MSDSGDIPRSPDVIRGSAPKGTFQIPDEGLRVPPETSFLSRFRNNLFSKVTITNPVNSLTGSKVVSGASASNRVDAENSKDHSDNLTTILSETTSADSEITASQLSARSDIDRSASEHSFSRESHLDSSANGHGDENRTNLAVTVTPPAPIQSFSKQSDEKSPEQVADEVEDTLITVKPETDSLLSDSRPSYSILRFCAGMGLLDQRAIESLGLPLGFVWCPFGELERASRTSRSPLRCGTCGSFAAKENGGEEVLQGSRFWTCGFCGRNDNDAGETSMHANMSPQSYPERSTDTVEYIHSLPGARSPAGRGAIVLIIDENLESEEADWARAAAAAVHASASESGLRFALFTVGAGCSVAVRSKENATSAPVLEMMSVARASKLSSDEKDMLYIDIPKQNPESEKSDGLQYLEAYRSATDPLITARRSSDLAPVSATSEQDPSQPSSGRESHSSQLPREEEARRLDIALFVAFELISSMADSENSRILSLVTGPPTLAHHALRRDYVEKHNAAKSKRQDEDQVKTALTKLYEQAGSRAGDMRIALDFLCFGAPDGFGGDILLGAAKRSRGGLLYSAAHSFSASSALAEAATFLAERSTSPGVVSIRVSSPLTVARVIGPAFPTAAPHTYAVPGVDPLTGFTIVLKSKAEAKPEGGIPSHAIVQLAAKSLGKTRVVTTRIPLTSNSSEYTGCLDSEISALVLSKACVVSGGALTNPATAARSIDLSVRRLLQGSKAAAGVARLLYELRRGLLLEQHVHPDCSLVLRSFFLRTESSIACLLMSPRLFTNSMSDQNTGLMAEVPLERKYVTRDAVLVLDTGFNVFVYVGEGASAEAEEAISQSARSVAAHRLSPCQLWKMRPGQDADFVLDCYLSPRDGDGRARAKPIEQGFVAYCSAIAPMSSPA